MEKRNTSIVSEQLREIIKSSVEPVLIDSYRRGQAFLAMGSTHGQRLILSISVRATEIPSLLKSKSLTANRPIDAKHVKEIKKYIVQNLRKGNKWILGALTANVDPNKIKYQRIWDDLYIVIIDNTTYLDVVDGQHRKQALKEIVEGEGEEKNLIAETSFPVNLVLESSFEQSQTDFHDLSQTLRLPKSELVAYAGFGRDAIAKEVAEKVNMFRGKTNKIKSSPGSRSGYIYTLNYIGKLVSCAYKGNPQEELAEIDTNDLVKERALELSDCLNEFFTNYSLACQERSKNIDDKETSKLTEQIIEEEKLNWEIATKFRENYLLGFSIGLEILGDLLYYTFEKKTSKFNRNKVKEIAENIDWRKNSNLWKNIIIFQDENGKIKFNTSHKSVKLAVETCLKKLNW